MISDRFGSLEDKFKLAFKVYDFDNDLKLSKTECFTVFRAVHIFLKLKYEEKEFENYFQQLDKNGDSEVDQEYFIQAMITNPKLQNLISPF